MEKTNVGLVFLTAFLALLIIPLSVLLLYKKSIELRPIPTSTEVTGASVAGVSVAGMDRWESHMRVWERQYGVPVNVQRAVITQESGGNSNASVLERPINGETGYAVGLWQVFNLPSWGRFAIHEDPFDPDTNTRVGINILISCNQNVVNRYGGSGVNWTDPNILWNTFACYNAGWNRDGWPASSRRYADNVLYLAGYGQKQQPSTVTQHTNTTNNSSSNFANSAQASYTNTPSNDLNMCNLDPIKRCTTELDWQQGWCDAQIKYGTGKTAPGQSSKECVLGLNVSVQKDKPLPVYGLHKR